MFKKNIKKEPSKIKEPNDLNYNELIDHIYKLIDFNKKDKLVSALDELLLRKKTVDIYYLDGNTLPMVVLFSRLDYGKKLDMLKFILEKFHFDLTKENADDYGGDVLIRAAANNELTMGICEILLKNGANINAVHRDGTYKYFSKHENEFYEHEYKEELDACENKTFKLDKNGKCILVKKPNHFYEPVTILDTILRYNNSDKILITYLLKNNAKTVDELNRTCTKCNHMNHKIKRFITPHRSEI